MKDFDSILREIGEFGRYQRVIYFVCLCTLNYQIAFNSMGIVFLAATPEHWCNVPSIKHLNLSHEVLLNLTIPKEIRNNKLVYSQCQQYNVDYTNWTMDDVATALGNGSRSKDLTLCKDGWTYDTSIYASSITTEWNLVCGRRYLAATAASVFMAGLMAGGTIFGFISDRYGRKTAYSMALVLVVIGGVLSTVSPNYEMFTFCRFLVGAGGMGTSLAGYILGIELVGPKWIVFVGVVGGYFWTVFLMILPGIAYFFRAWRTLAMVLFLPQVLSLIVLFFLPESPRWLYSQNKHDKADRLVRKMARCNGVTLPEKLDVQTKKDTKRGVFLDLLRHKQLRWRLPNICFQWCSASMVYYGLSLGTSNFGGNHYLNFLIGAALEIPATIIAHLAIEFIGRKKVHAAFMLLSGAVLLAMLVVPQGMTSVEIGLPMAGRFFISAAFMTLYIFSAELFPTVVRNVAMSAGSLSARVGGIIAPYLASMIGISHLIPYLTFGLMAFVSGLLGFFLPETKDRKLPEVIEDADIYKMETIIPSGEEQLENLQDEK